ncbi:MAG: gliding motility-associated C-terminal domain-containing protein, partial [Bacteroidota bacterium]
TTLGLSTVVIGTTTGFDVNGLLIQGGGAICGALDVSGAPFSIADCPVTCDADAGTLTAATPDCLPSGGVVTIGATTNGDAVVPTGFATVYVLTSGAGLVVEATNNIPSFTINSTGSYTIHTLVYDSTTLDLSTVVIGTTTGFDVNGLLIQGGGAICGALDVSGASFDIIDCVIPCVDPTIVSIVVVEADCGVDNGRATVNVAGNLDDYLFIWTPDISSTNMANNLEAGIYNVEVINKSDASCTIKETFAVGTVDGPEATIVQTTPATCNEANGTATLSPFGFDYEWCSGETGNNAINLPAGTCIVKITDPATGCMNFIEVEIDQINPLMATPNIIRQPDCGFANGEVAIVVTGGSSFYSYLWADGDTSQIRNDLAAGIYGITVTDLGPTGCVATTNFVLTDNVPGATVTVDSVLLTSCVGAADAMAAFTIDLSPGFATPETVTIFDANGMMQNGDSLGVGEYCIEVKDANDCVAGGACFEVRDPERIDVDVEIRNEDCTALGSITLKVSGGQAPYTFDWADIAGTTDPMDRPNLQAGAYSFTVTDANGCTAFESAIQITDECDCEIPVIESIVIVEASCGNMDGSVTITMSNDPSNYTFTWDPSISSDNVANNIVAETYSVSIVDATDDECAIEETFTVGNADFDSVGVQTTPAGCGLSDGTAILSPNTFTYEWSDGVTASERNDLAEGRYFVTVTNPNQADCQDFLTITILSSSNIGLQANINAQPTCNNADGSVSIVVPGGNANYNFIWNDGFIGADRPNLSGGIYTVNAIDTVNGACQSSITFGLNDDVPSANVTLTSPDIQTSCKTSNDAVADFNIDYDNNFAQPATIQILDDLDNSYVNGQLGPGSYCILIRDANNCIAGSACFDVSAPEQIDLDIAPLNGGCEDGASIEVTSLSGGNGSFSFDWSDLTGSANPEDRFNLDGGSYSLMVTDSLGCSATASVAVEGAFDPIELDATDDMITCEADISLTASSSLPGIDFTWFTESGDSIGNTATINLTIAGSNNYIVVAEDANGCTEVDTTAVTDGLLDVEMEGDAFACEDVPTQFNIENNDPADSLTYVWTPASAILSGANTANPMINTSILGQQTIMVEVTNQFGCSTTESFDLAVIDTFSADIITNRQCDNLAVDFSVDGPDLTYYTWNFGDPSNPGATATGSSVAYIYPDSGTYTVTLDLPQGANCPVDPVNLDLFVAPTPLFDTSFEWEYESCTDTAIIAFIDFSSHSLSPIMDWQWTFSTGDNSMDQNTSIVVDEDGSITVELQVTTESGCIDNITQTIDIDVLDVDVPENAPGCPDEEVALYPNADPELLYNWSPSTGIDDPNAPNPIVTVTGDQTYTVVINNVSGCEITAEVDVFIQTDLDDFTAIADVISCDGEEVDISASSAGATAYQWSDDPDFTNIIGNSDMISVTPGVSGDSTTYYVQAVDQYNCEIAEEVIVTNHQVQFTEPQDATLCLGDSIAVSINLVLAGDQEASIDWEPSDIILNGDPENPIVQPEEPTTMIAVISNQHGCSEEASFDIDVVDLEAQISLTADPDSTCKRGDMIQLDATQDIDYTYDWSENGPGGTLDATDISNPIASPDETTIYDVEITDEFGCVVNRQITITVIDPECNETFVYLPNAFTPNDDGKNDVLFVRGVSIDEVSLIIYNRWGEKVFETQNQEVGWDGRFNGEDLSSDVYGYYLRARCFNGQEYIKKGNISLLR